MSFLSEITPQDTYIVKLTRLINLEHISAMIDLYQPIIGSDAIMLYLTLANHIPFGKSGCSDKMIHRHLLIQINISILEIVKTRRKLEAVGLLKSIQYKQKDSNDYIYEYTVLAPLEPLQFFQSDILSILLFNQIGKSRFEMLQNKLCPNLVWNDGLYIAEKDMTKSFDEVFAASMKANLRNSSSSEIEQFLQPIKFNHDNNGKNEPTIKGKYLDIDFISGMVSDIFHLELTDDIILLLHEVAFLYQLTEIDIIHLLRDHTIYDETEALDEQKLRNRVREKHKFQKKEVAIQEKEKVIPEISMATTEDMDKAEKHTWVLNNYSPIQLMEQYQGGGKIPDSDLMIIESLMSDFKLPSGVINVLVEYIMLTNDYKLPKKLTEKIAGHWKRSKINSVEDALTVAKKEHKLYKAWKDPTKKGNAENPKRKNTNNKEKKEKIPDYILQQDEKYHQNKGGIAENELNDESMEEINKLLKELGEV